MEAARNSGTIMEIPPLPSQVEKVAEESLLLFLMRVGSTMLLAVFVTIVIVVIIIIATPLVGRLLVAL
jgi:hypothetical protein